MANKLWAQHKEVRNNLQQVIAELNEMAKVNEMIAIANVLDMLKDIKPVGTGSTRDGKHPALRVFGVESFEELKGGESVLNSEAMLRYNDGNPNYFDWKTIPLGLWKQYGIETRQTFIPGQESLVFVSFSQEKFDMKREYERTKSKEYHDNRKYQFEQTVNKMVIKT